MKILHHNVNVDGRKGEWRLDIYGDTHLGSKSVAEDRLRSDIKETRAAGRDWCHVGDVIDGITTSDRRFSQNYQMNLDDWAWAALREGKLIEAEWERFVKLFSPIHDSGLFVLAGDGKHNEMHDVSDCFGKALQDLGIPGGYPATFLMVSFSRSKKTSSVRTIPFMFHHGWFAGRTNSNKVIQLERALNQFPQVRAFVCGHGHNKVQTRINSLIAEGGIVGEVPRRAAMTGSYLCTYKQDTVGYGEVKGYPSVAIGKITMVVRPFIMDKEKQIEFENM